MDTLDMTSFLEAQVYYVQLKPSNQLNFRTKHSCVMLKLLDETQHSPHRLIHKIKSERDGGKWNERTDKTPPLALKVNTSSRDTVDTCHFRYSDFRWK